MAIKSDAIRKASKRGNIDKLALLAQPTFLFLLKKDTRSKFSSLTPSITPCVGRELF